MRTLYILLAIVALVGYLLLTNNSEQMYMGDGATGALPTVMAGGRIVPPSVVAAHTQDGEFVDQGIRTDMTDYLQNYNEGPI